MTDHRTKRPLRAAAALTLGLAAAVLPNGARAQFFGGWGGWDNGGTWDGLAPQQVRRAIAERGFRVLAPLRRNGSVFVADVVDGRGRHERLIVAAADAQILQRFLVDDGRGTAPRGTDDGRGFAARNGDEALVPPADIPDVGRRVARPLERPVPPQRLGDLGDRPEEPDPALSADPSLRRAQPPIRTVKPRPRVVERTPEAVAPAAGAVESTPLAPPPPRATAISPAPVAAPAPAAPPAPAPVAKAPVPARAPAVVASRPDPAPPQAVPAAAPPRAAPTTADRRRTDPLAIPDGGEAAKPVRSVAAGITGTPAPAPAAPAAAVKPGDVPVAPLD